MNGNAIHFIRARINYTVTINFHSPASDVKKAFSGQTIFVLEAPRD